MDILAVRTVHLGNQPLHFDCSTASEQGQFGVKTLCMVPKAGGTRSLVSACDLEHIPLMWCRGSEQVSSSGQQEPFQYSTSQHP